MLDVRNQSNVSRLIKTAQDAANQTSVKKTENLCYMARLWVDAGDVTTAVKTIDRIDPATATDAAHICIARAKREIAAAQEISRAPRPSPQSTADTKPPIRPVVTVSDWTHELDGKLYNSVGWLISTDKAPLSTEPFLDLAGHLRSLPPSDSPQNVFKPLYETAVQLVREQNNIQRLLKRQASR